MGTPFSPDDQDVTDESWDLDQTPTKGLEQRIGAVRAMNGRLFMTCYATGTGQKQTNKPVREDMLLIRERNWRRKVGVEPTDRAKSARSVAEPVVSGRTIVS